MKIKKRNGKVVEFDKSKISNAVIKAFTEVTGGYDPITVNYLTEQVLKKMPKRNITVEGVQDKVVRTLHEAGYHEVGTAYTIYRFQRDLVRKSNTTDESILSLIRGENKEIGRASCRERV